MSKNLYENIKLLAPDGELLCLVAESRANWYIKRALAARIDEKTVKLNFEPKARERRPDWYYSITENKCVVCGAESDLEKHHVVPRCFRIHLPSHLKDRKSFDVLLLCHHCHSSYEVYANQLKNELAREARLEYFERTAEGLLKKRALKQMRSCLNDSKYGRILPSETVARMKQTIHAAIGKESFDVPDIQILENEIEFRMVEVYRKIANHSTEYDKFIIRWRRHFLDHAKPKYLHPSWSKDIEKV